MSVCPHCERKLRLADWRPNCPGCGVNLMFHGFEERFYEDAKRSELSMAAARAKLKRFKASFKGNLPAKLRTFTCILPLLSLLLPMGSLSASLPFAEKQWSAGLLGIADFAMGGLGDLSYLRLMLGSGQSELFRYGLLMLAASAVAAVMGVLVLLGSFFSFLSMKNMPRLTAAFSIAGALACAGGFIAGILLRHSAPGGGLYSGSLGFGAPLAFAMFCWTAALNVLIHKRGLPVRYDEGEFERAEIYRRVKAGEINLDDLPCPVVETDETRKLEALIEQEMGGALV